MLLLPEIGIRINRSSAEIKTADQKGINKMKKILFLILSLSALLNATSVEEEIQQRKLEDRAIEEKQYEEHLLQRKLEQKRQDDKDWERRHSKA